MNGARGEACAKTSRSPKSTIMSSNGRSQNFFRTRMKRQSSEKMENLLTATAYSKNPPLQRTREMIFPASQCPC